MTGDIITSGTSVEGIQFGGAADSNAITLIGDITTTCASGGGSNCFGINIAGDLQYLDDDRRCECRRQHCKGFMGKW